MKENFMVMLQRERDTIIKDDKDMSTDNKYIGKYNTHSMKVPW